MSDTYKTLSTNGGPSKEKGRSEPSSHVLPHPVLLCILSGLEKYFIYWLISMMKYLFAVNSVSLSLKRPVWCTVCSSAAPLMFFVPPRTMSSVLHCVVECCSRLWQTDGEEHVSKKELMSKVTYTWTQICVIGVFLMLQRVINDCYFIHL